MATHRGRRWWSGLALACMLAGPAVAQPAGEWPSRPIRVVVPYAVGGPSDVLVRIVAPKLAERLGQPIVVDNRVGASGNIGTDFVAKSAPDGYTLVIGTNTTAANATLFRNLPFDIVRDFAPVTTLFRDGNILVVKPSFAGRSVAELVAIARAKPGTLSYASSGNGTSTHLAGVLLTQATKTDITHVPYKGIAAGVTDVMGGQRDDDVRVDRDRVAADQGRAPARARRDARHAAGGVPATCRRWPRPASPASSSPMAGAASGRPPARRDRSSSACSARSRRCCARPEIREAFANRNVEPGGEAPEAFARAIATDIQKLAVIVRASGATLD